MDRLAFNASAAITEMRLARQNLANDMANMTTTGFKRSYEVSMKAFKAEGEGFDSNYQPQAAHMDFIQMKPGPLMATGRDLDIMMNDQTVLGVQSPNGELAFTRRGDLRLASNGTLETGNGMLVRGQAGGPITIPPGFKVTINTDGSVYAVNPGQAGLIQPVLIDRLMLRDASQTSLERREDGLFTVSGKPPGTDIPASTNLLSLTPKALEGSNVNPMEVMIKLMEQSRSFEQAINVIKQSKDADQAGSTMMKPA